MEEQYNALGSIASQATVDWKKEERKISPQKRKKEQSIQKSSNLTFLWDANNMVL